MLAHRKGLRALYDGVYEDLNDHAALVVKAEVLPKGPNVRFVVTNLPDKPQVSYDQRYTARGPNGQRVGQGSGDDDSQQALQNGRPRGRSVDSRPNRFFAPLLLRRLVATLPPHLKLLGDQENHGINQ